MKAFWTFLSMYPLATMKDSHRRLSIDEKTFPMHDVRAIGLKFPGSVGVSLATSLGIRWITPSFHA
jgi:hypothetical protein